MAEVHEHAEPRGRRRSMIQVGTGSLVAALSSYLLNVLSARSLSVEQNTILLTLLAVLYFYYGVLSAITTEFTRSVAAAPQGDGIPKGRPAWQVALILAALVALAALLTSPVWRLAAPAGVPIVLILFIAIGLAGYSIHCASCGVLAGSGRWSTMALLVGAEGVGRMLLASIATILVASATGYLVAVIVASFTWVIFLLSSPATRTALRLPTDRPPSKLLPRFGAAFLAQASSVVLTVGFPMLLAATTSPTEYAKSAPLLLAVSLTRAPLLIPLAAYQSVIVRSFVQAGPTASRALLGIAAGCLGVGLLGAAAAYFIGPTLMVWIFSESYWVDGLGLAGLVLAAASITLVTITGAMAQAMSKHVAFVSGWLLAVVVTVIGLLVPGAIERRAIWSLIVGPLFGAGLHTLALMFRRTRLGSPS